ncbi:MAG: hypothetical protein IJU90_09225 [Bacteroidales bacterium]|nr:hypothetical protein [Bacteroidales bacterium]
MIDKTRYFMFDFLKRKNKIEPIFEVLGVDMHNHMVPGVDDGSESLEMSAECIGTMWEAGFRKMFVTPHFNFPRYNNDEDDIVRRYGELKQYLADSGVEMELQGIGGEYRIDDGFQDRLANPRFLKIGVDNYLLLEISMHHHRMGFEKVIYDIQMNDQQVILAHPERYLYLDVDSSKFEKLKDQGVIFQCNILSLSGFYGGEPQKRALKMIERGWVELLGTDMHNTTYARGLAEATHSRTVRKVLEKYEFMNRELVEKTHHRL